jgi:hypothetical protein
MDRPLGTCSQPFGHQNPHPHNESAFDYPCVDWEPLADLAKRDSDGCALIGKYGDRMDDLRMKLSGWHFGQESLTQGERDILYVAERLLDELDRIGGGYYQ